MQLPGGAARGNLEKEKDPEPESAAPIQSTPTECGLQENLPDRTDGRVYLTFPALYRPYGRDYGGMACAGLGHNMKGG